MTCLNSLKDKFINENPDVNFNSLSLVEQNKLLNTYIKNKTGIGDSYFLRTGFINQGSGTSATVGINGAVQSSQARFLDGSTTRININMNKSYNRMQFNLSSRL
jgi:hypothetical protein